MKVSMQQFILISDLKIFITSINKKNPPCPIRGSKGSEYSAYQVQSGQ